MDRSRVKRLSVRTGVMAVVVLAMASPFRGPNPVRSEEPAKGAASAQGLLMKAHDQLEIALHYVDLAIASHQPGVGWHKTQTQRAINVVVGAGNPEFNKEVENP